jgi:PAS domain S-box-containing protein
MLKKLSSDKDTQIIRLKSRILDLSTRLKKRLAVERSLLKTANIHKDIFNTVRDGIVYTNLTGTILSVNQSLAKILELAQETLVGKNILTLVNDKLSTAEATQVTRLLKIVVSGKAIGPFQVRFLEKILEITVDVNLKGRNITGTIRDITETRKISDALSRSEARLKRAELSSKSGNWELHLETGTITGSEGAMQLYGLHSESLNYQEIRNIPLPEYRQMMDDALHNLIHKNKPYNIEFKIKKVDTGEILDIHSISEYDRENRILYGSIQDITDRKIIKEQLIKKNRDLSKLFRISVFLLESVERDKILLKIVENAANLMSTDTCAIYLLQGENLYLEVTYPALPVDFPEEFRSARLKNHPHINQAVESATTLVINDISDVTVTEEEKVIIEARNLVSMVYIPLFIQKKVAGVIILGTIGRKHEFVQHEIDLFGTFSYIASLALENSFLFENLKEARDKAEESNRLKTAFLHNISHEIRTPLNAIVGFSGIMCQSDLTDEVKNEYFDIISQSNQHLTSIIDDIINISQIETGQVLMNCMRTYPSALMKNLYRQFSPEAHRKGLEFKLETVPENPDFSILTDENKVIAILSNLLNNAFKFTMKGSVYMGCSQKDDTLEFYVSDTGTGIPKSEQDKVFERFYQIDTISSKVYGGLGLGLAISAAYAQLLGGQIRLESEPEKGSKFYFTIPFQF